jgi:hypothetical protein
MEGQPLLLVLLPLLVLVPSATPSQRVCRSGQ